MVMYVVSRAVDVVRQDFLIRIVGMGLLFASLDPIRFTDPPGVRYVAGAAALVAGGWAGPPLRERPSATGHRLSARISRHRNTLLASVSVLFAATTTPPTWLMVTDLVLVLTYLSVLDLYGETPGTPLPLGVHAVAAWVAAAVVLAAALVPVTGGWWGRIVAAAAVLAISALMYGLLRLGRPATYQRPTSAGGRRH
jgi:hypothetical protein